MAKAKKRHDTAPLVRLIKSYVHENGGRKSVAKLTAIKSESTYAARNRNPDEYQIGELISIATSFRIPKHDFLLALVSVFDISADVVDAVAARMKTEERT